MHAMCHRAKLFQPYPQSRLFSKRGNASDTVNVSIDRQNHITIQEPWLQKVLYSVGCTREYVILSYLLLQLSRLVNLQVKNLGCKKCNVYEKLLYFILNRDISYSWVITAIQQISDEADVDDPFIFEELFANGFPPEWNPSRGPILQLDHWPAPYQLWLIHCLHV